MLHQLDANIYCWTERHGRRETTYYWNSFAIHIEPANILALVDPLPMSFTTIEAIEEIVTPSYILLTCNWHLRDGDAFRQRWGCKISVNELGSELFSLGKLGYKQIAVCDDGNKR